MNSYDDKTIPPISDLRLGSADRPRLDPPVQGSSHRHPTNRQRLEARQILARICAALAHSATTLGSPFRVRDIRSVFRLTGRRRAEQERVQRVLRSRDMLSAVHKRLKLSRQLTLEIASLSIGPPVVLFFPLLRRGFPILPCHISPSPEHERRISFPI
jgi:hypothetical protein